MKSLEQCLIDRQTEGANWLRLDQVLEVVKEWLTTERIDLACSEHDKWTLPRIHQIDYLINNLTKPNKELTERNKEVTPK